jgi:hypothetical protein
MKQSDRARRALLFASLGGLVARPGSAEAQDPTKVMPKAWRIALENAQVRVLEFTGRPGLGVCGEGMHSHPAHLTIVLSDWQGVATTPDGKTVPRDKKVGDVFWSEAETHKVENTGRTNARVLLVELKAGANAKAKG